jgi:hypothetical protein
MNEVTDPVFQRPTVDFSSVQDFRVRYQPWKEPVPDGKNDTKFVPASTLWLDSKDRRYYKGIVFSPNGTPDGYYNLWKGFGVEPKKGKWNLYEDHIYEVISDRDVEIADWVLAWMASIVQEPGGPRPGTSIVLRGRQGAGKGCFAVNFGKIFGHHFTHITNQQHVTSRFNSHLKECLFAFVDEGFWAGDPQAAGVLKALVTEEFHVVEQKFKDPIMLKNLINIIIASNSSWVVPAGPSERRFCVLDVSEKRVNDRDYFRRIYEQMNDGGIAGLLYDLKEWDISGVDLREIPKTAALLDQIEHSMDSVQAFWYDCLVRGSIDKDGEEWPESVEKTALHQDYLNYCKDRGTRYRVGEAQFSKQLRNMCPWRDYRPNTTEGRQYHYLLPSLVDCRRAFSRVLGVVIQWERDDEDTIEGAV